MKNPLLHRSSVFALLAVGVAGCSSSPDDAVVGIYSYDEKQSKLPEAPGMPEINRRLRESAALGRVKLMSDHTFVITGSQISEGKWERKGDKVLVTPAKGPWTKLMNGKKNQELELVGNGLRMVQTTPFGEIRLHFRKTG